MNSEPTYTCDPSAYHALVERHFTFAAGVARNAHRYKIREQVAGDAAAGRFEPSAPGG